MAELARRASKELFVSPKHCSKKAGEDFLLDTELANNLRDS